MQAATEEALSAVNHMDAKNIADLICSYGDNNWMFVNSDMIRFSFQIMKQTSAHHHTEDEDDDDEVDDELMDGYYVFTDGILYHVEPQGMLSIECTKRTYSKDTPILVSFEKRKHTNGDTLHCTYKILSTFTVLDEMETYLMKICRDIELLYDLDESITLHVQVFKQYVRDSQAIRWYKDDQFCSHYHKTLSAGAKKFLTMLRADA